MSLLILCRGTAVQSLPLWDAVPVEELAPIWVIDYFVGSNTRRGYRRPIARFFPLVSAKWSVPVVGARHAVPLPLCRAHLILLLLKRGIFVFFSVRIPIGGTDIRSPTFFIYSCRGMPPCMPPCMPRVTTGGYPYKDHIFLQGVQVFDRPLKIPLV